MQSAKLHEAKAPTVAKPALLLSLGGDIDQVPLSLYKPALAGSSFCGLFL